MTLGIRAQPFSGSGNADFLPYAGERIHQLTLLGTRVTNSVGSEQRYTEPPCKLHCCLIASLFFAVHMALKFGINVIFAEDEKRFVESRTTRGSSQADESFVILGDLFRC